MKVTKVHVDFTLNDAASLIEYLGLLRQAMDGSNPKLREILDSPKSPLSSADWQGAARCLEPLKEAVSQARTLAKAK